jgi:hypothetical protein
LIFGYLMLPSRDFTPAISFSTINKNNFRTTMLPRASVTAGFWIISHIRRQELLEQRILQGRGQDWPWQNHEALPRKPFVFLAPLHIGISRVFENNYQHCRVIATFSSVWIAMMLDVELTKSRHFKWRLFIPVKPIP